jgi:hypothetical protein
MSLDSRDRKALMTEFSKSQQMAVWRRAASRDEPVQMAMRAIAEQGKPGPGLTPIEGTGTATAQQRQQQRTRRGGVARSRPTSTAVAGATDTGRMGIDDLERMARTSGSRAAGGAMVGSRQAMVGSRQMMMEQVTGGRQGMMSRAMAGRVGGGMRVATDLDVGPRARRLRSAMGGGIAGGMALSPGGGGMQMQIRDVNVYIAGEAIDDRHKEITYDVVRDVVNG